MHLIDVLIGRLTERVTQFGHDKLSVFGIGRELNEKQWRAVIRQLVAMGHLRADSEAFGALKLTESARGVLKGETEVMLREEAPGTRDPRQPRQIAARRPRAAPAGHARRRRSRLARARCGRGVPMSRASAACRPMSCCTMPPSTASPARGRRRSNELRGIPGIGDKKLEHYGEELIALVRAHGAKIGPDRPSGVSGTKQAARRWTCGRPNIVPIANPVYWPAEDRARALGKFRTEEIHTPELTSKSAWYIRKHPASPLASRPLAAIEAVESGPCLAGLYREPPDRDRGLPVGADRKADPGRRARPASARPSSPRRSPAGAA